jgi:HEAT repeat protein
MEGTINVRHNVIRLRRLFWLLAFLICYGCGDDEPTTEPLEVVSPETPSIATDSARSEVEPPAEEEFWCPVEAEIAPIRGVQAGDAAESDETAAGARTPDSLREESVEQSSPAANMPQATDAPNDDPSSDSEAKPRATDDAGQDELTSLIAALTDKDVGVRIRAAEKLAKRGSEPVPAMIGVLKHKDAPVRRLVAETLGYIGPDASVAAPALIVALDDQDGNVRLFAARSLGDIGAVPEKAVPALVRALDDPNAVICVRVVDALGKFGPHAKAALPKLREIAATEDNEEFLRDAARKAILKIER